MKALDQICREDPSIYTSPNDDGSLILSGMGELHMEIITDRIKNEFKVDAYIGPINVAYREQPLTDVRLKGTFHF